MYITAYLVYICTSTQQQQAVPPMGWLRLVGSLKLQVSFTKEPYKRDDILQKRPAILRNLLIVATPYTFWLLSGTLNVA